MVKEQYYYTWSQDRGGGVQMGFSIPVSNFHLMGGGGGGGAKWTGAAGFTATL